MKNRCTRHIMIESHLKSSAYMEIMFLIIIFFKNIIVKKVISSLNFVRLKQLFLMCSYMLS